MSARRLAIAVTLIAMAACTQKGTNLPDSWPDRKIDIVVYSSAGGSTDLTNRVLAHTMDATLGVDVVVVNMPGALGGTAVNYVWNQPHDGYRVAGLSEGALAHAPLGLTKTTAKDWHWYMVGGTPGVLSVRSDSPYTDFASLLAAIEKAPGKLTIATSVPGSIWHIQWLNVKKLGRFDTRSIPFAGSQPSQVAALAGEVDIVWTGLGEQAELIKGGRFRPLAVFSTDAIAIGGQKIPSITDYFEDIADVMPLEQFVGFAIPVDTPDTIRVKLDVAFSNAMASDAVEEFAQSKYMKITGFFGDAARRVALRQEWKMIKALEDVGLAKQTAEMLGVSEP